MNIHLIHLLPNRGSNSRLFSSQRGVNPQPKSRLDGSFSNHVKQNVIRPISYRGTVLLILNWLIIIYWIEVSKKQNVHYTQILPYWLSKTKSANLGNKYTNTSNRQYACIETFCVTLGSCPISITVTSSSLAFYTVLLQDVEDYVLLHAWVFTKIFT